mmetsp:Transcript_95712/g.247439  ORF Transcript_95712/g.247439 Transcript_95712/m.247439 type:complete len:369 (-) Transcript_95712:10-1116(-)
MLQVLDVLLDRGVRCLHQDALELLPVDDPEGRLGLGLHRRRPGHQVEEGELTEAAALRHRAHVLGAAPRRRPLGALPLRLQVDGQEDFEGALLHDVEVVGREVALGDDLRASGHRLLPRDVDDALHPRLVQRDHRLQVLVGPQGIRNEVALRRRLRRGRPRLQLAAAAASDGLAVGELELLIEPQLLEQLARDLEGAQRGVRGDCRRPRLVAQQRVLAEVVASLQLGHLHRAPVLLRHLHPGLTGLDDEELGARIALLDDCRAGRKVHRYAGGRQDGVLVPRQAPQQLHLREEAHGLLVPPVRLRRNVPLAALGRPAAAVEQPVVMVGLPRGDAHSALRARASLWRSGEGRRGRAEEATGQEEHHPTA